MRYGGHKGEKKRGQHAGEGRRLTQDERLAWLRLIRSENVGPQTFHQLMTYYGSADLALAALPELAHKGGKKRIRLALQDEVMREFELADKNNIHFIGMGERDYPPLLRLAYAPPPLLGVKGNLALLREPLLGIVGGRNASAVGQRLAANFAKELGEAGLCIISGFARGIDRAAHQASLATGTIAAMAGGLDKIYPPENKELYTQILAQNGTIISEMPLGWEPRAKDFPRRNRLISGCSYGVLVVEAARRSGSLITARLAAEDGRLVFSVPGSPLDPNAAGSNGLIKEGAILADTPQEIIAAITPLLPHDGANFNEGLHEEGDDLFESSTPLKGSSEDLTSQERSRLLSALSLTAIDIETLSIVTELSLPRLYLGLLELELAGRLMRHRGGLVSLILT